MIKRPFLGFFIAFVLGELLGLKIDKMVLLLLVVAAVLLYIFLRYIKAIKSFIYLIFLAFLLMGILRVHIFVWSNKSLDNIKGLKDKAYLKNYELEVKNTILKENKLLIEGERLFLMSNDSSIKKGDKIQISGRLEEIKAASNYGNFDAKSYYLSKNIAYRLSVKKLKIIKRGKSISELIKTKLRKKILRQVEEKEGGLILAILLGERSYLDKDLYKKFRDNGISHILAISGLHISLIGLSIYSVLRKNLKLSYFSSGLVATLVLYIYSNIVGDSASVYRAVAMLILVFVSNDLGRDYDMLTALSVVGIILCIKNPYILFQTSFILSFMAVFSISIANYYICRNINEIFFIKTKEKDKIKKKIINILLVAFYIQIINIIPISYYFFYIPTYAIFLNFLVLPLMSILCISGFVLFLPNIFVLSKIAKANISFILYIYEFLCNIFSKFYHSRFLLGRLGIIKISIYYILILLPIFILNFNLEKYRQKLKSKFRYIAMILFCFILAIFTLLYKVRIHTEIYFLDVRKGFCNYISVDDNNILIDIRGKDLDNSLETFLLAKAIDKIDFLFLSELSEEDRINLLDMIKRGEIKISKIVLAKYMKESGVYKKLKKNLIDAGVEFVFLDEADKIRFNNLSFYYVDNELSLKNKDFNISFKGEFRRVFYKNELKYVILKEKNTNDEKILSTSEDSCISLYLDKNSCNIQKFRR